MLKKCLCFFAFILLLCHGLKAQLSEINAIKIKYFNFITDGAITSYANNQVRDHYNRYLSAATNAQNNVGTAYDLNNPGPKWDLVNDADDIALYRLTNNYLYPLVVAYHLKGPIVNGNPSNPKYHSPELKALILKIFGYIKAKGVSSTSDFTFKADPGKQVLNINNSDFGLRSIPFSRCIFLMKEELTAAGEFDYHMATLNGYTKFLGPQSPFPPPFTHPGYNADVVRSLVQSRLCYILAQNDNATDKVANMDYFKQFTNNACLIGTGWSDFIKPDFITYHHQRPYPYSYGGFATSNAILINYILKSTPYELDAQAQQNIKNCLMIYPKICADFDMPRSLTGRFPGSTSVALAFRYFFALLYATDPNNNQDVGKEFKRIYALPGAGYDYNANTELMLGEIVINLANNAAVTPASPITGHFGFPYAGLNIHKYNGYQASVSGLSQYILNYEANATENVLGRYQSSGAMELLTVGNPKSRAANGLATNGWDWVHVPGVTGENVTFDELAIGTPKEFNDRRFLAHATLDNYGVFAMDYKDINSSPKGLSAYKTSFFYKDKILCLGTGIKHTGGTKAIHTTLFQTALTSAVAPTLINGTPRVGLSDTFSQTNGSLWATDAVGNGYVIPASEYNNNQIVITRSTQTSRDVGNTTNTQGDYAKAYLNHGVAPANGSYRYAIVMQGNTAGTQDLASNFASYFDVLQQDNKAHVVKFVEDNTYN